MLHGLSSLTPLFTGRYTSAPQPIEGNLCYPMLELLGPGEASDGRSQPGWAKISRGQPWRRIRVGMTPISDATMVS